MINIESKILEAARNGERAALNELLRRIERPVFNIALRFLVHKENAEDATQEILIKIITNLGTIKDDAAAGAWAFKIAIRHLIGFKKKGAIEAARLNFQTFGKDLEDGLVQIKDENAIDAERNILASQVKIGCTLALLTCLSRTLRASYILGEIYEIDDKLSSEALIITQLAHRKRLERANKKIANFTKTYCGIVENKARCNCLGRVSKASIMGRVGDSFDKAFKFETMHIPVEQLKVKIQALEAGRRAVALMRSNPNFISDISEHLFDEGLI